MQILSAVILVLAVAIPASAQARPKACRYVVDVQNQQVAMTTQPTVSCEYDGKILMTVNNLDDARYRLEILNFKFDPANVAACASPSMPASPLPINGNDGGGAFKFNLNKESTHTKKKEIKVIGQHKAECFKFDIWLYNEDGSTPIHKLDPELTVSEPQLPPPAAPPAKKPGPGR